MIGGGGGGGGGVALDDVLYKLILTNLMCLERRANKERNGKA